MQIGEIVNRQTANIHNKTTVYTHVNDDRRSHIENSKNKVILLYRCT